jgi:hypothetical protein
MDDITRRYLIKMFSASLAASVFPSCTNWSGRDSNSSNYIFNHKTFPVIDMHGHFFNATDVLAVEYLTGPALNDFVGDRFRFTRWLLEYIANAIVDLLSGQEIRAKEELSWLQKASSQESLKNMDSFSQNSYKSEYHKISKAFYETVSRRDIEAKKLNKPTFEEVLKGAYIELVPQSGLKFDSGKPKAPIIFNESTVLWALDLEKGEKTFLNESFQQTGTCPSDPWIFKRIMAFAGRALVRRSTNVMAYYDKYTNGANEKEPAIKHVLNIGCDFDYFLGCKTPESPMADQIAVNEEIWRHTNGYAIPVLGVNPWKFASQQGYKDLIAKTLSRGIYKGVKLYPSIGYSVTGKVRKGLKACNGVTATETNIHHGMETLFDICKCYDAFITSHTTHSKGATRASIDLAGPSYWKEVMSNHKTLRVNFGHMGDPGNSNKPEWRQGFLKLMSKYENVYADFGYHSQYANYNSLTRDLKSFKKEFGRDIFKKMAYGSDWYMISKDKGANAYLCDLSRHFDQAVQDGIISGEELEAIFYGNAESFLGLNNESSLSCEL